MGQANTDGNFVNSMLQESDAGAAPPTTGHVSLHARKILVVDDNPVNLEIAAETLRDAGAIVTEAINGHEALHHIGLINFDLVVLDLTMPDIDGIDVGRGIRTSRRNGQVPLLIFTASDTADARMALRDLCAQDIVAKPMDIGDLLGKAERHIKPL